MAIEKTGKRKVYTLRSLSLFFFVSLALQAYYLRLPNSEVGIFISLGMFGGLGVGAIAPGIEVLAETTYPADQTVGLAIMSLLGFIKGTFLMFIENVLGDPLTPEEQKIQVCQVNGTYIENGGSLEPMNHSKFIYFATGYMFFMVLLFGLFFNTKLKRTMADEGELDVEGVTDEGGGLNKYRRDNSDSNIECDISPKINFQDKINGIELSDIKSSVNAKG